MATPRYTVVVTNLTQGWTLTAVHGIKPDPATTPVVLTDPAAYTWAFDGDTIPSARLVCSAAVNVAAWDADTIPETQVDDLVTLDVRLGTTGPRIIAPPPMQVTLAAVTLTRGAHHTYRARLAITLADLSADWISRQVGALPPGVGFARQSWRPRMAEVGAMAGLSVGCPTTWADDEGPTSITTAQAGRFSLARLFGQYAGTIEENLVALVNSHQPADLTHTLVTVYGAHPAGYRYVGPDHSWDEASDFDDPIAEPASSVRVEIVPASRRMPGATGLPLVLAVVAGQLTTHPRAATAAGATTTGIDSAWCTLPATARRARESAVGQVVLKGQRSTGNPNDGTYAFVDSVYATGAGVTREVPTQLYLGGAGVDATFHDQYAPDPAEPPVVAARFLSDPSTLDTPWAYDGFELVSSLIPTEVAATILPKLAPRLPGETDGDGRLTRHVTLYNLDPDLRFRGRPAAGFITGGTLTVADGDLVWTLATTPGQPQWTDTAPTPITVADFDTHYGALNPSAATHVQVGDLAYVNPTEAP